jgi:hypothetical protein
MSAVGTEPRESPEARLLGAGFARRLELWVTPDGERALSLDDAIAGLDSGQIRRMTLQFPDTGVRALPDELVDRISNPPAPSPPPWLELLAELMVKKLKPVVRAEVRAALTKAGEW